MKNFQVMVFNAVILIALGVFGYSLPPHSPTALIAPGIGAILLILAFFVKKENSIAAYVGVGLTGISFLLFIVVGVLRMNTIIFLMAVVTLLSLVSYISDFLKRKSKKQ
jgi:hypothetical protein